MCPPTGGTGESRRGEERLIGSVGHLHLANRTSESRSLRGWAETSWLWLAVSDVSAAPIINVLTCKGRTEDLKWKWIIPFCATFFYHPLLIVCSPPFSPSPPCTLSEVTGRSLISSWEKKKRLEDEFSQHKGPFPQGAAAFNRKSDCWAFFPPIFKFIVGDKSKLDIQEEKWESEFQPDCFSFKGPRREKMNLKACRKLHEGDLKQHQNLLETLK